MFLTLMIQYQAIRNIEAVLRAVGTDLSRIICRKSYYIDIHAHSAKVSAIWSKVQGEPYPATTAVQVGALAISEALIEMDCVAELPE